MIERLKDSRGAAFGFKVVGRTSGDEVKAFEPQIESLIKERKELPIGILADLSQMEGADWKARWNEMRFLQKYTDHIARMAVVGADKWEEVLALLLAGTTVLQAETRYFVTSEIAQPGTGPDRARMLITYLYEGCISVQVSLRTMFLSTRICKTASEDIFDVVLASPQGEGPSGLDETVRRNCRGLLRGQVPLLLSLFNFFVRQPRVVNRSRIDATRYQCRNSHDK